MILTKIVSPKEKYDVYYKLTFQASSGLEMLTVRSDKNPEEFLNMKLLKIENIDGFPYESKPLQGYCDFTFENGKSLRIMMNIDTYNKHKNNL